MILELTGSSCQIISLGQHSRVSGLSETVGEAGISRTLKVYVLIRRGTRPRLLKVRKISSKKKNIDKRSDQKV